MCVIRKKKQKKVYFFDFIDLNPLYHIVGLNPFWFDISDCVLSVVAPFFFLLSVSLCIEPLFVDLWSSLMMRIWEKQMAWNV